MRLALLALNLFLLSFLPAAAQREVTVLQWNIWQEGSSVKGGYESIVSEIARLRPDFVTLSEVRNYHGRDLIARLRADLQKAGVTYYGFSSYDSGLLSRYPITDSLTVYPERGDHGSIYGLRCEAHGKRWAVYTAHLDYLDCAYYNARGYDGSSWRVCPIPRTEEEVLARNALSHREEALHALLPYIQQDEAEGRVVILGGDFNEPSHRDWTAATRYLRDHHGLVVNWPCTTLLEREGFVDAYRALYPNAVTHPGFTFPADNPAVPEKRLTWTPLADERERIDYLFVRQPASKQDRVRIDDCRIYGPRGTILYNARHEEHTADAFLPHQGIYPSDHKGLLLRLSF